MPRLAAGGTAEGGFAQGGRLEDAAFRTWARVVGRGFARRRAVGTIGLGFTTQVQHLLGCCGDGTMLWPAQPRGAR